MGVTAAIQSKGSRPEKKDKFIYLPKYAGIDI